ncbi:MAG: hypothetical protein QXM68_03635 [Candidatus Aenigmatarchaeota archaeon]|nr:hypothetical protein [Candidatus Aenigmarchaeota archaeon]
MDFKWILIVLVVLVVLRDSSALCCENDIECYIPNPGSVCATEYTPVNSNECCSNKCCTTTTGGGGTRRTTTDDNNRPPPTTTTFCYCGYTTSTFCPSSSPGKKYYYGNGCGDLNCRQCDVCIADEWKAGGCGSYPCKSSERLYTRTVYSGSCASVMCVGDKTCTSTTTSCIGTIGTINCTTKCGGIQCSNKVYIECTCCDEDASKCYSAPGFCSTTYCVSGSCSCTQWISTGEQRYCPVGFELQTRECTNNCDIEEKCVVAVQTPAPAQTGSGSTPTITQIKVNPPTTTTIPPNQNPTPNQNPIGTHESLTCDSTTGWACDPDSYSSPLQISFYADGARGTGTLIGSTTANLAAEQSICSQCGGRCNHRFSWQLPAHLKDGRQHSIYAYAIGDKGEYQLLSNSPRQIQCSAQLNIDLELILENNELNAVRRGNQFTITARVYSGSALIQGANVYFEYFINGHYLPQSSCTTNQNGECSVTYTAPNEYGILWITATATYQSYPPTLRDISVYVVDCFEDNHCQVYEYCTTDNRCFDLRPIARSCNYFDYCANGLVPGTNQPCQWNVHCYSANVDQSLVTPLCNDGNYIAHALVTNCGG